MLNAFLPGMRFLLVLAGALALLYTLSYPDNILPPDPVLEDVEGFNIMQLKPLLWLLPLLWMELWCYIGKHRNKVWFSAMLSVLVAALVALPVLRAQYPELVRPTLPFEGGMLYRGLLYYAIILFGSVLVRLVLLRYLFPEAPIHIESGSQSSAVLNPEEARSVKEIAAHPVRVQPKFLFGPGDEGVVTRFRKLMRRIILVHTGRNTAIALGILGLGLWVFLYPQPTPEEALLRDKARMYSHRITPQGIPLATRAAVHAAYRVMKEISDKELFAGMNRRQAEEWLGLQNVPEGYRAWLRDERDVPLPSVDNAFESRTRFLTVQDGRRISVLYIRTNEAGDVINVAEVQDAGWNAVADERRRRFGNDWGGFYR